ncbi:hypothetical protein B0A55_00004 [Friedmanniomyces simplex]|uniref:RNA polymerase I-specific transcription initiation factor RRN3 n=1 Tax=Friedmanniomyces simplex TaxID=329884 RepID=A0A4U0Y0W2_9PEZI|nr:hypothetical protein B0A55_00004 [Friedmanniomyces simplex]
MSFARGESSAEGYVTGLAYQRSQSQTLGTNSEDNVGLKPHRTPGNTNEGNDWLDTQLDLTDYDYDLASASTDATYFTGAQFQNQDGGTSSSWQGQSGTGGEDCCGLEQTNTTDNASGDYGWLGPQLNVSEYAQGSSSAEQAHFAGGQLHGLHADSSTPLRDYAYSFPNSAPSGPWGVGSQYEDVTNDLSHWSFDGNHSLMANNLAADNLAVHNDPLLATAQGSSLAATNFARDQPTTTLRLALPTPWNAVGFSGPLLSSQPNPVTRPRVTCDVDECGLSFPRHSFLDTDDEAGLTSSTKRLRVAFSPKVDVRIMDDWSEKSYDLVKEEVRLGIEQHLAPGDRRDDAHYVKLLQLLGQHVGSDEAPSSGLLKKYLLAINARVSSLGQCSKLVGAVLDLAWLGRDDVLANLYLRFLMGLATAHSKYIPSIMEKLVSHFARLPASLGRLPGEMPVPRATMFKRVHRAIRSLLRQVPSATAALTRVLKAEFPDDLATSRSYLQYQKHLLRMVEYLPELKAEILAVLTQRLVNIDVQVQLDLEDLEDEAEESLLQQKPRLRAAQSALGDSDDSDDESVSESEETMADAEQRLRELRLKVAKMDGTMDLLFEYYTPLVQSGLNAELNDAYHQLLAHFETFILPNRTRHAQFLVFHFSQTLPEHANLFARQCLHAIFETGRSLPLRLHACAYLASFVARGAHLPTALVREIFAGLSQELESMRKRYEPSCRGPDKRSYSVYYAIAQAMLYIFCFRWRDLLLGAEVPEDGDEDLSEEDLLAEGRELAWLPGMKENMQKSIHSRLNPLKVCSPAITGEFARLALHVRFLYVFSILESNKRVRLGNAYVARSSSAAALSEIGRRETAMDRKLGEAHLQLEAYFPFDPYHLPRSKRWVEGDYNEWKVPAGMMQEEDDEGEDSSDESDEDSLLEELEEELPEVDAVSVSS